MTDLADVILADGSQPGPRELAALRRERDERIFDGYTILFDERLRCAHIALLQFAEADPDGECGGWPTPKMVQRFARFYDVDMATLGGLVSVIPFRHGRRTAWANMARDPQLIAAYDEERFTRRALAAFGFFWSACAVLERECAALH